MTFSFIVNGLFTFRAGRLTVRHALLFLSTTGAVLWLLQPLVIHALLVLAGVLDWDDGDTSVVLAAKVASIGVCFVANFCAYRFVVWPHSGVRAAGTVSSDLRP